MSGMQRWKEIPAPCPKAGEAAPAIAGLPAAARTNWQGDNVILDVDSWKMGEGGALVVFHRRARPSSRPFLLPPHPL
jgi:hypothetical protein